MFINNDILTPEPADHFPVVGIGASAGGLDAFKKLLKAIPEKSGMSYVLVQHLAPEHESVLPELLGKVSKIPVHEIENDIKLLPDHAYVIPPNKILTVSDGFLKLSPRDSIKTNLIIDVFFTSLASVHESRAVGILLSGSGSDGTIGLKIIKEHGGITIVQDQESATFGNMPQSAVNAGVVDLILPLNEIPGRLMQIEHVTRTDQLSPDEIQKEDGVLKKIIAILNKQSGVDFSFYKLPTIRRRIARRMAIHKSVKSTDYLAILQNNKAEQEALFQDMLIPVTSFFRDKKIFELLQSEIFPSILRKKERGNSIRVWVAGCSTGEEAYTIAIELQEFLGEKIKNYHVQIFASDISLLAIKKARTGIYTKNEVQSVPDMLLEKYFKKVGGEYLLNKSTRDLCLFAQHNFLQDPPFAKMDMISCRNVLIYMDNFLQNKALTTFHYSLNENGVLILGKSETTGAASELFNDFNKQQKAYSRKQVPGRYMLVATERKEKSLEIQNKPEKIEFKEPTTDFRKKVDTILLSKSPSSVTVNEHLDIVHIHGDISPYLKLSSGKPNFNILKMAREGLALELRNLLHKSKGAMAPIVKDGIVMTIEGRQVQVTIEMVPLINTVEPFYLILFTNTDVISNNVGDAESEALINTIEENHRIHTQSLMDELKQAREDMLAVSEEQETANEELQSSNEELQSSMEEMQSINEELENSKEELESTNEELIIVNQELMEKQDQLFLSNIYSESIIGTIREPMLVINESLRIKTANRAFYKNFNLHEDEVEGKLFFELQNHQWDYKILKTILSEINAKRVIMEDFECELIIEGRPHKFLLNARRIEQNSDENLILLAIEDVTHSIINKRLEESEIRFRTLCDNIPHMIWTASSSGEFNYINQVMFEYTQLSFQELQSAGWSKLVHELELGETLHKWNFSLEHGTSFQMEHRIRNSEGNYLWHITKVIPQKNETGNIVSWIGTHTNIEEHKNFAETLELKIKERTYKLEQTNFQLDQFAYAISHDLQEPLRKISTFINRLKKKDSQVLTDEIKQYLDKMDMASGRMSKLIHDLLNYSRLTNITKSFELTDLNQILKNIIEDFDLLVQEKSATLTIEELPVIQAIPIQMNQLFHNLIGNALKFSRPGIPPEVRITSRILDKGELVAYPFLDKRLKYYEIIVHDNGIGFEEKYSSQIFNLFQRLNHKDQYTGTGIGLALSKKIIENHHGEIFADAEVNKGASFHILLPA